MTELVWIAIIQALLALVGVLFTGWVSIQVARVHRQFNSRMDQMLDNREKLGREQGKAEEQRDQRKRDQE